MLTINITALAALLTLVAIVDSQQIGTDLKDDIAKILKDCKKPREDAFCLGILTSSNSEPIVGFPEGQGCLADGAEPCNTLVVGHRRLPDPSSFNHVLEWHFYNRERQITTGTGFSHFIVSSSPIPIPDTSKKFLYPENTVGIEGSYSQNAYGHSVTRWAPGNVAGGSRFGEGQAAELQQLFGYKSTKTITTSDQQTWFRHSYSSGNTLNYTFPSTNFKYTVDFNKELYALIAVGQRNEPKFFSHFHTTQPMKFFDRGIDELTKVFEDLYNKCSTTDATWFCVGAKLGGGIASIEGDDGCIKARDCDALVYGKRSPGDTFLYTMVKTKAVGELVFYLTKEAASSTLDVHGLPPKTVGVRMVASPKQIASDAPSGDTLDVYEVITEKPRMITFISKDMLSFTNGYAVNLATDELFTVLSMKSVATGGPFIESRPAKARKLFPKIPTTLRPTTKESTEKSETTEEPNTKEETTTGDPTEKSSGLGWKIAIAVGVLLLVALLIGVGLYLMTKRKDETSKPKYDVKVESGNALAVPEVFAVVTPVLESSAPLRDRAVRSELNLAQDDVSDGM